MEYVIKVRGNANVTTLGVEMTVANAAQEIAIIMATALMGFVNVPVDSLVLIASASHAAQVIVMDGENVTVVNAYAMNHTMASKGIQLKRFRYNKHL